MAIRFDEIQLYSSDNHYYPVIHASDSQRLRVQGSGGRVDIGTGSSTSWGYILTDRANFYVDKGVHFDGNIQGYGGDETASFATYYDRNNTAYYVNPAGASNVNGLDVKGQLLVANNSNPAVVVRDTGAAGAGASPWVQFQDSNGANLGYVGYGSTGNSNLFIVSGQTTGNIILYNTGARQTITTTHSEEAGSYRAPIFYDLDNTAYYIDPANTGNAINVAGEYTASVDHGNSGFIQTWRNTNTGGGAYVEHVIGNGAASELRIGHAPNYGSSDWNASWVYAVGKPLFLKSSSNNVVIYAGGAGASAEVAIFDTSLKTTFKGHIDVTNSGAVKIAGVDAINSSRNFYANHSIYFTYNPGSGGNTYLQTGTDSLAIKSTSSNAPATFYVDDGRVVHNYSTRSPIYYDKDDTGYYLNPAGTSNLNVVTAGTLNAVSVNASQGIKAPNQRTNYVANKWVAGSSFPQAAVFDGSFQVNGSSSENVLEYGVTPSGGRGLLWKATNNDVTSNADGGWAKNIANLSDDKAYISICYVKRVGSSTNGSFYHGCHGSHTLNMNGTANTNPYFISTNIGNLTQDVWCVSIGIIQANNDSNTNSWSDIDGVYRLDTGERILDTSTFKMKDGSTSQSHRTYLYYSTDANAQLQWYNPGFYEINGQEPTLNEILNRDKHFKFNGNLNAEGESYLQGKVGINTTNPNGQGYSFAEDLVILGGNSADDGVGITLRGNGKRYGVIAFGDNGDDNPGEIFYDHNSDQMYFRTGTSVGLEISAGNVVYVSDIRSTIYYDSNDTNYYVDPAAGTVLGGTVTIHNDADSSVSIQNGGTNASLITAHAGDELYLGSNNASKIRLHSGGAVESYGDFRAPIFYDSDNTNYYINPASTSLTNVMSANNFSVVAGNDNGIGFWGGTAGGNGSYAIYMSAHSSSHAGRVSGETTSDYNMYFKMSSGTNRGFNFKSGTTVHTGIDASGHIRTIGQITGGSYVRALDNYQITLDGAHAGGPVIEFGATNDYDEYGHIGAQGGEYQFGTHNRDFAWYQGTTKIMELDYGGANQEPVLAIGWNVAADNTKGTLQVFGHNNTDGTLRLGPHSSKGTIFSHVHYGSNGDWYIRPASNSGSVFVLNYSAISDERLKENIVDSEYGLSEITSLRPRNFNWIDSSTDNVHTGFVAQEVEAVVPKWITQGELDDHKSVDYNAITATLVKAVQELKAENEDLLNRVKALENK